MQEDAHTREVKRAAVRRLAKAVRATGDDPDRSGRAAQGDHQARPRAALEEEMTEHFGDAKHAVEGRNGANSRNGPGSRPF